MPPGQRHPQKEQDERDAPVEHEEPTEDQFEEFVAAALKVDPKGLSGKHRRKDGAPHQAKHKDPPK